MQRPCVFGRSGREERTEPLSELGRFLTGRARSVPVREVHAPLERFSLDGTPLRCRGARLGAHCAWGRAPKAHGLRVFRAGNVGKQAHAPLEWGLCREESNMRPGQSGQACPAEPIQSSLSVKPIQPRRAHAPWERLAPSSAGAPGWERLAPSSAGAPGWERFAPSSACVPGWEQLCRRVPVSRAFVMLRLVERSRSQASPAARCHARFRSAGGRLL